MKRRLRPQGERIERGLRPKGERIERGLRPQGERVERDLRPQGERIERSLRPKGAATSQPRATPWVYENKHPSALKGRENGSHHEIAGPRCDALSGLVVVGICYPGRCPGLACFCPVGAPNGALA